MFQILGINTYRIGVKMTQMERVKQGFTVPGEEYSGVPREDIKRMQRQCCIFWRISS